MQFRVTDGKRSKLMELAYLAEKFIIQDVSNYE